MEDRSFVIYSEKDVYLGGNISEGSLQLKSEVYGDDYSSEKHYVFSEEDTQKLFSIMSLDQLIDSCKKGRLLWLEEFLKENDIKPSTITM